MEKNKKLRLLVTKDCHNSCPKCCNKLYDLNKVPVLDRFDYDEVCITGGEPLLDPGKVKRIASMFKSAAECQGRKVKVYVYTARLDAHFFVETTILDSIIDGFVLTPHSESDLWYFKEFNDTILQNALLRRIFANNVSMRLNLFADVKEKLKDENLSLWKIKDMEWLDDCPVPEGEDFRRIVNI